MKRKTIYFILTIIFILVSIILLVNTNLSNNVLLSRTIEIILILFLIKISIGCIFRIKKTYEEKKYSYKIITRLGLIVFLNINILRLINVLIVNWKVASITDIYNKTLQSFSFFALVTLPCIVVLSIYSIISNIVLIKKEGFYNRNLFGIIFGIVILLGIAGIQLLYLAIDSLELQRNMIFLKKFMIVSINAVLSYLYSIIIAALYCNVMASRHIPKYDKDFVIILGCKIGKDGELPPLLKSRVDRAIEFSKKQKKATNKSIVFVPSGGQGKDEITSEAEAMKEYLKKNKIKDKNIIIEDKSTSTKENMLYSKDRINEVKVNSKIAFSTSNYHVFRSGVIASKQGIDCEGMGSKTKWYFYSNALIREFVASLYSDKKEHIFLIVAINVVIFFLVFIGYHYKFFNM